MLSCGYIGSNFPGKGIRTKGRSSHKPKTKGFYDLWNRHEAHEFTVEILRTLGFASEIENARSASDSIVSFSSVLNSLAYPSYISEDSLPFNLIQARALFSKNDDFDAGIDKERVAFSSWLLSEQQCLDTNQRWASNSFSSDAKCITYHAQQFCARVLGIAPRIDELDLRFGPGATTSCSNNTSARWKLSSPLTASNSLFRIQNEIQATIPVWANSRWIPSCGALEFVPKNWKTYRSIDVQPTVNTLVQKGLGTYMKRRLLMNGINLYDQSINQRRALEGSRTGCYATLDLERASDTLSYLTVMNLLPWDWFQLLDASRTAYTTYEGKVYTLNKFSSMGNGFTFELESLIFAALCYGIETHFDHVQSFSVYGDDIIIDTVMAEHIFTFFPEFGFSVNDEKSFIDGPFRESCGADYAFGVDVRPFFLKGLRSRGRWTYASCFSFHNFLQRKPWFDSNGAIRRLILQKIPLKLQTWGPDGYGDGHLVSHSPLLSYASRPQKLVSKGYEGYIVKTHIAIAHRNTEECPGDLHLPAYLAGLGPQNDVFVVRAPKQRRLRSKLVNLYVV